MTQKSVLAPSMTDSSVDGSRRGSSRWSRGALVATIAAALLVVPVGASGADTPGAGSTDATVIVETGILLEGLPAGVSLTGQPGETATNATPFEYTVYSNDTSGYTVTVQAQTASLIQNGGADTIEVGRLLVQDGGNVPTHTWAGLSSTTPTPVYTNENQSATDGDLLSTDFQMKIPVVDSDTYTVTLNYLVSGRA